MKIYTKTGDQGETGLLGGSRVPKNHVRIEAVGTLDEANAALGVAVSHSNDLSYRQELQNIQGLLFEIGGIIANPTAKNVSVITEQDVRHLEILIDELNAELPLQTSFILPGGTQLASQIHLARTLVRRAERRIIGVDQHQDVPPVVIQYVNRLSDYLFILARTINHEYGVSDIPWHSRLTP
jgi:cob(I)alamin adenosyltransferase